MDAQRTTIEAAWERFNQPEDTITDKKQKKKIARKSQPLRADLYAPVTRPIPVTVCDFHSLVLHALLRRRNGEEAGRSERLVSYSEAIRSESRNVHDKAHHNVRTRPLPQVKRVVAIAVETHKQPVAEK